MAPKYVQMTELSKYTNSGKFNFTATDILSKVCDAPEKHGGVYVIYAIKKDLRELIYVGISGRIDKQSGNFIPRADGIKGRIVKGKRDGESRKNFWIREMINENIDALEINWFVTYDEDKFKDCPAKIESNLIKQFRPRWNRK